MNDWKEITLESIADPNQKAFAMGPFGSNIKKENYANSGVPVIRGINLGNNRFNSEGFVFLTEEKAGELKGSWASPDDIVFVAQGTVGKVGIIPSSASFTRYVLSQNLMKFSCDKTKACPLYLYYYYISHQGQHEIMSFTNPTGVPCISRPLSSLKKFKVSLPPLAGQERIAEILGSLDDKIENNRRMNETLEGMARAIFKSWFVDFDPVKAKVEGRDPKLPKEIADLFPDSFEESELGPIPKGWKVDMVSNVININPRTKLAKNTVAKHVDMKALPTVGFSISGYVEKEYKGGSKFCKNDVLLARITPCLENGKTSLAYFLDNDEVGFGSTEFIVMRGKGEISSEFVYCLARDEKFRKHCISSMVGSSGRQRVQNACFDHYYLAIPSNNKLLKSFKGQMYSLFNQMIINAEKSISLASLRDVLLPKLLSGELRVPEAGRLLEG